MPRHVDFLIVGGGLAGATAAETLRSEGATGSILIVTAEKVLPYNRPPLSKRYLQGKLQRDRLLVLNDAEYRQRKIDVLTGSTVRSVKPNENLVLMNESEAIAYEQLLIATGASPKRLAVPGSDLDHIHYLREIGDADALREAASGARRAVVIGGSFVGLEVAGTLTKLGVGVTILCHQRRLLSAVASDKISDAIYRHYTDRGVTILSNETAVAFRGEGRVGEVVTQSGHVLPCDMVVAGIGVVPNTAFLEGSGIKIDDGVIVDRCLRTAEYRNVLAAGDVAKFPEHITRSPQRVEHWDNAIKQGRVAARNMLGGRLGFDEVSYFYCDAFGFNFEFVGYPCSTDRIIERGSLESKSYAAIYVEKDVPNALFTTGRPSAETAAVAALIRNRVNINKLGDKISDPDFSLQTVPNQTVLVFQGGGAMGAFECGVMRALEERQICPDVIAGVSIGAFNGAIIAGNPRNPAAALDAFWNELAITLPDLPDWGTNGGIENAVSAWYNLTFGTPKFFRPRWMTPVMALDQLPLTWTSFYDPSPVKDLLLRYVDFSALRQSPIRLLVSAVDVETAELLVFDSYSDDLTPDHILASGSLPPAFPWTTIDGRHYWDGGMISNSPLEQVMERSGLAGKRIIVVDLYSNTRALPKNMMEVLARRDEIVYAERMRSGMQTSSISREFHALVNEMLTHMEPEAIAEIKQRPRFSQLMGDVGALTITRIVRQGYPGEPSSRDYNFSAIAIEKNKQEGYERAIAALDAGDGGDHSR